MDLPKKKLKYIQRMSVYRISHLTPKSVTTGVIMLTAYLHYAHDVTNIKIKIRLIIGVSSLFYL